MAQKAVKLKKESFQAAWWLAQGTPEAAHMYVSYIQIYILVHSAADLLRQQLIRLHHGCWRQSAAILAGTCVSQPGDITVIDDVTDDVTDGLT